MGAVMVQPRDLDCACWHCLNEASQPVLHRLDPQAAQRAVDMLGIQRPVLIEHGPLRGPYGAMAGWKDDHWLVWVDDRTTCPDHSWSATVWHELGHVLDFEQRVDVTGECISPDHATLCMMEAVRQQYTYSDYANSREERFANEIMHRYGHHNLEVNNGRPIGITETQGFERPMFILWQDPSQGSPPW